MAVAFNQRKFSGANGVWNFLPDNGSVVLTRNAAGNVTVIAILNEEATRTFTKTLTRNAAEDVTAISEWVVT